MGSKNTNNNKNLNIYIFSKNAIYVCMYVSINKYYVFQNVKSFLNFYVLNKTGFVISICFTRMEVNGVQKSNKFF